MVIEKTDNENASDSSGAGRQSIARDLGKSAALGGIGGALLSLFAAPDLIAVGIIAGAMTVAAIRVAFLLAPGGTPSVSDQDKP
ncbi:MAG: hypothetical protein AAF636_06150 [Pseudomonadota bacterium]